MRLNWIIGAGTIITIGDIQTACHSFFDNHKVVPDTVKMTYKDMSYFINMMPQRVMRLDRDKDYGNFIIIPGGMVELILLEESDESVVNLSGGSIIVIESTKVDREFEKHVLNKDT